MESNRSKLSANNSQVQTEINELKKSVKSLIEEGNYLEADNMQHKIEKIINNESVEKTKELKEQQLKERLLLSESYTASKNQLTSFWSSKLSNFTTEAKNQEDLLLKEHKFKLNELITKTAFSYPKMKPSAKLLLGKKQEENLGKCKRTIEAMEMKKINEEMERKEKEMYEKERIKYINKKAEALGLKQEEELKIFKEKTKRNYDLLLKEKEKAFENLELNFNNKKHKIKDTQKYNMEIAKNINKNKALETSKMLTLSAIKEVKERKNSSKQESKYGLNKFDVKEWV